MAYLNLDLNYFDHIKTVRLVGLLGKGAAELPIRLWCYCGKHKPEDGKLTGYSAQEIESIVGWWGKEGAMLEAMLKVGFIEEVANGYKMHGWEEREGHLAVFHERAKVAATKRWDAFRLRNASSNASSINKQCPIPNQTIPNQTKKREGVREKFVKPTAEEVTAYAKGLGFALDGEKFVAYYESKGWVIGRSPMRSWKATVVTWKKNGYENGGSNGNAARPYGQELRIVGDAKPRAGKYDGIGERIT